MELFIFLKGDVKERKGFGKIEQWKWINGKFMN